MHKILDIFELRQLNSEQLKRVVDMGDKARRVTEEIAYFEKHIKGVNMPGDSVDDWYRDYVKSKVFENLEELKNGEEKTDHERKTKQYAEITPILNRIIRNKLATKNRGRMGGDYVEGCPGEESLIQFKKDYILLRTMLNDYTNPTEIHKLCFETLETLRSIKI